MPISAAQLMANRPSAEEEQKQFVEFAQSMKELLSQQIVKIAEPFPKVHAEPRYSPFPLTLPPVQRQRIHIVIDLTLDSPL
jgi:hypothetical protein